MEKKLTKPAIMQCYMVVFTTVIVTTVAFQNRLEMKKNIFHIHVLKRYKIIKKINLKKN